MGSFPCPTWGLGTLTTSSHRCVGETTTFADSTLDCVHQRHRDGKSVARNGTEGLHRTKRVL